MFYSSPPEKHLIFVMLSSSLNSVYHVYSVIAPNISLYTFHRDYHLVLVIFLGNNHVRKCNKYTDVYIYSLLSLGGQTFKE